MKKSFMTRALATGLSFAMAFSLSAATNVTVASAAAKKTSVTSLMKSSSKTVVEGKMVKAFMRDDDKTAKKYRIKSHTETAVAKKYISVKMRDSRRGLDITAKEGALAAAKLEKKGVNVKIYFAKAKSAAAVKKAAATKYVNLKVVVTAKEKEEEKPDTTLAIESVTATKVNELTVTFKNAVATSGASVTVTKGSTAIETSGVKWAVDSKSAVITTVAKMTKGTYTVTVKAGEEEATGTAEIVAQYVASIQILNDVALTGKVAGTESKECYVYYDVLDQYGESLRNSTTIDWSTSVKKTGDKKSEGKITLERTDGNAFTYGEQIYITGVYSKTGVSVTKTLTVGSKQSLNSVEVAGFAKKGTNTLLTSLPAGFKSGAYYLVYSVLDQNGNSMSVDNDYAKGSDIQVTFVSDNVLVVKEMDKDNETNINIAGVDYKAVPVVPGQNVDKGGEVNITAIANKTGNKSEFKLVVGDAQILKSFVMSSPEGVVADGETVEIPFVALDQNGKEIKDFVTLASQTEFSNLTLNSSEGRLYLEQQKDGTAKLYYKDLKTGWQSDSADGVDRPISLTSVVVGGDTSNHMIYVSDKARPDAIKDVDMSSVLVEGGQIKYTLSDFTFLDQYGREIKNFGEDECSNVWENVNRGYIKDNGFFNATSTGAILSGADYSGYVFGVQVEYKGNKNYLKDGLADDFTSTTPSAIVNRSTGATGKTLITSSSAVTAASDNQTVRFTIVKTKSGKTEEVSTSTNKSFKIVDISKVGSFEIKALKKQYVETEKTGYDNLFMANAGVLTPAAFSAKVVTVGAIDADHVQTVEVVGKYSGESVTVPHEYYTIVGKKIGNALDSDNAVTAGAMTKDGHKLVAVVATGDAFTYKDLYDANSSNGTRKDTSDTITATIYTDAGTGLNKLTAVSTKLYISDAKPAVTTIKAADEYTFRPTAVKVGSSTYGLGVDVAATNSDNRVLLPGDQATQFFTDYGTGNFKVYDQYEVKLDPAKVSFSFKVSNIEENAAGYAENNFTVNANDSANAWIDGAELGDKFVLTLTARCTSANGSASKDLKITVGPDWMARLGSTGIGNLYKTAMIGKGDGTDSLLEDQRKAGLGN